MKTIILTFSVLTLIVNISFSQSGWFSQSSDTTNGGVKDFNISTKILSKYILERNYPNPYNPKTIIFNIPKFSYVKLTVYNMLGQKVAVLVNEKLNSGSHKVSWDWTSFRCGNYFYILITDDFIDVKKIMVLK